MKKYMKYKFEGGHFNATNRFQENVNTQNPNFQKVPDQSETKIQVTCTKQQGVCPNQQEINTEQIETAAPKKDAEQTSIQPPLPTYTPPPIIIEVKQEVMDNTYGYMEVGYQFGLEQNPTEYGTVQGPYEIRGQKPAEPRMCPGFVRGTCYKRKHCIYKHEIILSQLPGIYTFCKTFEKRPCPYARCKDVHATALEREHFFKTGYLPPHATAHLKQSTIPEKQLPPPHQLPFRPPPPTSTLPPARPLPPPSTLPPPPPPPAEEQSPKGYSSYYTGMERDRGYNKSGLTDVSVMSRLLDYMTYKKQLQNFTDIFTASPSTSTGMSSTRTPIKRRLNETVTSETLGYGYSDIYTPVQKKCKNCDATEFSLNYHRIKYQNMLLSAEDDKKKMAILDAKTKRLCRVLTTLFEAGMMPITIADFQKCLTQMFT